MNVLGISAFYHDSAACLLRDGAIVAAAQQERFSRVKHDAEFPADAVAWCLAEADLTAADLDLVAFYDKPLLKFDRLLETQVAYAPRGFMNFRRAVPTWLGEKLHHRRLLDEGLGLRRGRYAFLGHHESHAASAFFPSPFDEAAILTVDGVGEWSTATIGRGSGNRIELLRELRFPHSLGLLYSAFTAYCGFRVNNGEYKLMGLAPYGEPRYVDVILDELVTLADDGSLRLHMEHFAFGYADRTTAPSFDDLFGGPPRRPGEPLTQRHMDVARSIQAVTEEVVLRMARHAHALTGLRHLVLAGGVALNCVANGRIHREGPFDRVWVQPAAGDAGGALGAALFVWHQLLGRPRTPAAPDGQRGSLLGPAYDSSQVRAFLDEAGVPYAHFDDETALLERVAELLDGQSVVGHFAGPMEFGPRALGSRSILADPRSSATQEVLNLKIKFRESFRPFAPAVLAEHATEYFEMGRADESPYMLMTTSVAASQRVAHDEAATGLARLKEVRSVIPAVTHVDMSARVQTVDAERFPRFRRLIERFYARTGVPVVVNTSFNVRGEPIVRTPAEAYACFMATNMDALVLEDCLLLKSEQPGGDQPAQPPEDDPESAPTVSGGSVIPFEWDPPRDKLRRFGFVALVVLPALATAAWFGRLAFAGLAPEARPATAAALAGIGLLAGLFSVVWPRGNRWLWVTLSVVGYPIGWVLSWVLLGAVFYGVVTPIGLILRGTGRDALHRGRPARGSTYWTELGLSPARDAYFRQF